MPSLKDSCVRRPSQFLWTPDGLVDLADPVYLRELEPYLLGTFDHPDFDDPSPDAVIDGPGGTSEYPCGFFDVDEDLPVSGDSSHDSDLMLG